MRIFTLWHEDDDDGEMPWIINAVDQYTLDSNGEFPPPYLKHRANMHVRELIIDIPENAVRALFRAPSIAGAVIKDDQRTVHEIPTAPASDEIPTMPASDKSPEPVAKGLDFINLVICPIFGRRSTRNDQVISFQSLNASVSPVTLPAEICKEQQCSPFSSRIGA
jgi:hypothetical protein